MNPISTVSELQVARSKAKAGTYSQPTDLVKAEHHEILQCFYQVGRSRDAGTDRIHLIQKLCDRLTIYISLKEEVVMPALEKACNSPAFKEQLDESVVEHFILKVMLESLDGQGPEDELFRAKLTMLQRQFIGHVGFEETFLLPQLAALLPEGIMNSMNKHKKMLLREIQGVHEQL